MMIHTQMLTVHSQLTPQMRLWLEQLPGAIALVDHQMHYISASNQWREILGVGDGDLQGVSYTQTCPILPVTWSTIERSCFAGFCQSWKTEHPGKDSQPRWLQWQASPWRNEAGDVGGLTLTVEEVIGKHSVTSAESLTILEEFRQLADNVPGMIYKFRLDPDGRSSFPFISSGCQNLWELTPEQVQQNPELMFEVIHPDDLPLVEAAIAQSAETLTKWECEWRITPASKQEKWLKGISQPRLQEDGSIIWDGCVIDISSQKRTEAQLQQSQQLLQLVLDNIPQLIFWKDQNSVYQGCNQNFAQVAGLESPEKIIGKTDYNLPWATTEADWYRQCDRQTMVSGQPELHIIETQQQADGRQAWVETNKIPLRDNQGNVIGILGTVEDITKRKQAEDTLKRYNETLEIRVAERTAQLQGSLQQLTDLKFALDQSAIVSITDTRGDIIEANQQFCLVSGYSHTELIGKNQRIVNSGYHPKSFFRQMWRRISRGQIWQGEIKNKAKDGSFYWVNTTIVPLLNEKKKPYQYISIRYDISDRKAAEEALQESETRLQQLAANVPGMIYQLRLDTDGTISFPYVSSGCRDVYGIEPQQLQQDANLLKIHPDDEAAVMAAVTFSAQTLQNWQYEWRAILPSGAVKWVRAISRPERQADGATVWNGCLIDIEDRKRTEERLKQFQQRLSLMIEHTPIAVIEWDTNMQVTAWNPAAEKIFGYSREEALGQFMDFIIPENTWKQVRGVSADLLFQTGGDYSLNQNLRKDGQTIFCEWYNTPLITPAGKVIGVASHALDVTERKQAEQQLQQTTAQLQEAQKLAHIGNWNYEIATGKMQWSAEVFRIHGLTDTTTVPSMEELVTLYHPQDRRQFLRLVSQAATAGQAYDAELRIIRPDGEVRHLCAKGDAIANEQGQVIRMFGTVMDITEQKQAQAILQQTTRDLQQAQRIAHIGNWEYDQQTESLSWSEEVFQIFNRPLSQGVPSLSEAIAYYYAEDIPPLQQALEQMIVTGEAMELELRVGTDVENLRYVNIKAEAVQNPQGQVTGLFGTVMDITARKQAEQQLQQQAETLQNTLVQLKRTQAQMIHSEKMSSLGQMVAGVAHEINNPVGFIHSNLTHLRDYVGDLFELFDLYQQHYPEPQAEIQDFIDAIELDFIKTDFTKILRSMKIGTERIRSIVLSLRNFARLDEAECKLANLHDGIDSTLMILQNRLQAGTEQPALEVIKDYGSLPKIECYPGQLNQVFMNIIDNAIDALESVVDDKQIRIKTEVFNTEWVRVQISNSGPSIADGLCSKVFDPFFTTKPVGQGTGLGLSVSYQIITEQHHGNIYCQGNPATGTAFIIEIPIHQPKISVQSF